MHRTAPQLNRFSKFLPCFKLSGLLFMFFYLFLPAVTQAENDSLKKSQILINEIRQGGYVLYMRHAASNRSQTDIDTVNLNDCSKQRNLSEKGREQSRMIGKAFKSLNIPVGKVLTSPYCRCVDTAKLAFSKSTKLDDLRFTISADEKETLRLSRALQKLLSKVPNEADNTVIVAHTGNLKEAAKVWPKPEGVVHVFKPLAEKGFEHLGRITPEQWAKLK